MSPFSTLLIMAALSVVGAVSISLLDVQYLPENQGHEITVSYNFPGASPEVVERTVTAKVEGLVASVGRCSGVESVSSPGKGYVKGTFRRGTDIDNARLEISSSVRNIWDEMPKGVDYPFVTISSSNKEKGAMSYVFSGAMPPAYIDSLVREKVISHVSAVSGVANVSISGAPLRQWTVTFDKAKAEALEISSDDISAAIRNHFTPKEIGNVTKGTSSISLVLRENGDFENVAVASPTGKVVMLGDIATWNFEESEPLSYHRVNGLNAVTMTVTPASGSNLLKTAAAVRKTISVIKEGLPFNVSLVYDPSIYIKRELVKNIWRTIMCIAILLLFTLAVSKSFRHLLIITITLTVNILIALAIYAFSGIPIHIYSIAGIAVSLGIIIDTSIVMIDHYTRWRNRKCFPSLLAAVGTTAGALAMTLLLPEKQRADLSDFVLVVVINLVISLFVSYLFIPALLHYFPTGSMTGKPSEKKLARARRWNALYGRYIKWGSRHRLAFFLVGLAAFGIPLCAVPQYVDLVDRNDLNFFEKAELKFASWEPYSRSRNFIDRVLGTSFALFYRNIQDDSGRRSQRDSRTLYLRSSLEQGNTVAQLSETVSKMESYLNSFEGIAVYTTDIASYDNAFIEVQFKPEYCGGTYPLDVKKMVSAKAMEYGGEQWTVSGIDDSFITTGHGSSARFQRIGIRGYNYARLLSYAETLADYISRDKHVSDAEVTGSEDPGTEVSMSYDFQALADKGVSAKGYYNSIKSLVNPSGIGYLPVGSRTFPVYLKSSESDTYDLWAMENSPVLADSAYLLLSSAGSLELGNTEMQIEKKNQNFTLWTAFNYSGSQSKAESFTNSAINYANSNLLPAGYKAGQIKYGNWVEETHRSLAWLVFLILALMYIMLAIAFESFRLPLSVMFTVILSFVGIFLVFGLGHFSFDQGGLASFVMLSGLAVNAGIYIVTTWREISCGSFSARSYVRAFSRKIIPIMLTVTSTILGLIPFLFDGPSEPFWFSFAVGTIAGMAVSAFTFVFVLPVFALRRRPR